MNREFHIHVDAWQLSPTFEAKLKDQWKFVPAYFAGHPDDSEGFEPPHHFTYKTQSSEEFRGLFKQVVAAAREDKALRGYVEGEFLPIDEEIDAKPFDPQVSLPVRNLNLGQVPKGSFRGSEIHIVMDADRSDPRLIKALSSIGLFTAYLDKSYGRAIIFTVGGSRENIESLFQPLREYLWKAGGSEHGSIKEERIAAYWVSHPDDLRLPPVVETVSWNHI